MNNAAIGPKGTSWEGIENWHSVFGVNVFGSVVHALMLIYITHDLILFYLRCSFLPPLLNISSELRHSAQQSRQCSANLRSGELSRSLGSEKFLNFSI